MHKHNINLLTTSKYMGGSIHYYTDDVGKRRPCVIISHFDQYKFGRPLIVMQVSASAVDYNLPFNFKDNKINYIQLSGINTVNISQLDSRIEGIISDELLRILRSLHNVMITNMIHIDDLALIVDYINQYNSAISKGILVNFEKNGPDSEVCFLHKLINLESIGIIYKNYVYKDINRLIEVLNNTDEYYTTSLYLSTSLNIIEEETDKKEEIITELEPDEEKESINIWPVTKSNPINPIKPNTRVGASSNPKKKKKKKSASISLDEAKKEIDSDKENPSVSKEILSKLNAIIDNINWRDGESKLDLLIALQMWVDNIEELSLKEIVNLTNISYNRVYAAMSKVTSINEMKDLCLKL